MVEEVSTADQLAGVDGSWASKLSEAESELDFLQLGGLEDNLLEASLHRYQQYLDELDAAKEHLDSLLTSTAATLDQLADISGVFKKVDNETQTFQKQSSAILDVQTKTEAIAEGITDNFQYYEPLERITRRMNAPGAGNFVRTQDFRDMLITLDECIDYMQTHPKHKEAETYRSRYRLLLTRALTLVRNTFMNGVRDVTADAQKRIADSKLNETTTEALLYAKFRVEATSLKDLGLEIQKRAMPAADAEPGAEGEYQSLMNELYQSLAAARGRILLPLMQKRLSDIDMSPNSKDLVYFARSAISYVRGVCLDEFELWQEYFHGQRGVYEFLETLCEPLYDYLRPRIIREVNLSKLCSLVTLLQTRYFGEDEEDDLLSDPTKLDFSTLIQSALEDAQTRLVFRAQALLREQIELYKPVAEDLDYPRRMSEAPAPHRAALSGRRRSSLKNPIVDEEEDAEPGTATYGSSLTNRVLELSYPTLPRSIKLLSRIYRLVHSSVFDDLAHQIVHQTTLSLVTASALISQKSSPADGQLFLLRHLLLLKSQIVAFDIEFVTPDVHFDFSGVASTFWELRARGGLFNPSTWARLFSSGGLLPRVVENMLDAKAELDGRLRTVINEFTDNFSNIMASELKPNDGKQKPMDSHVAEQMAKKTRGMVQQEVPILRAKLEQYLDDLRTRETLVAAVLDLVIQRYEEWLDEFLNPDGKPTGVPAKGGRGRSQISKKGKSREDAVWDAESFGEWAENLFNVALPTAEPGDGDSVNGSRSLSRSGSSSRVRGS